jgi:hypothetical protein
MIDMSANDYAKALPVAQGIIKMLELKNVTMTYGEFYVAMGLGPWERNKSRHQVKNILDMLDAIDHRAHGRRVLQLDRIVRASDWMPGVGVGYINRITRRRMTEAEALGDGLCDMNLHIARSLSRLPPDPQWVPDPVDPNCTSGEA